MNQVRNDPWIIVHLLSGCVVGAFALIGGFTGEDVSPFFIASLAFSNVGLWSRLLA